VSHPGPNQTGLSTQWGQVELTYAVVVVVADRRVLFFKDHPWERLAANVGIVLLFGAFYFRYLHLSFRSE
jgi:hypothetical protein